MAYWPTPDHKGNEYNTARRGLISGILDRTAGLCRLSGDHGENTRWTKISFKTAGESNTES
ncbi:hypothetical protein FWK35_00025148 [Aphis craccivora]|uniref:Uncharacterized protein n=1 Tax=Aphis craccivora TaxID=307492 RepID=A0A6G0Z745_APHCR|nr:hypothetical protein FWK35_00025148 [Aphis craccivora]